ncbi:hypothetical protein [Advenella sp. FME57]|uniref:hypothetical protein n=1 Tax=Advenella sp. FME57 TaxID=2742604 RepID=UPI001867D669|nr:hypothetical protein [Advenella sp. FME57]
MTVQCIECCHFTLQNPDGRAGKELAAQGFGTCKYDPTAGSYQSAFFERQCQRFAAADRTVIVKRRDWVVARKREFLNALRAVQAREIRK